MPSYIRDRMEVHGHIVWHITRGLDGCLFMFHQPEWDSLREQLDKHPAFNPKVLNFRRFLFGGAAAVKPDGQGRMAVPQHLREYAGLDKEVVLLGVGNHLELWDRDAWRAFQQDKEAEFKEMAALLFAGESDAAVTEKGGIRDEDSTSGSGIG